jgi:hypothetical protein
MCLPLSELATACADGFVSGMLRLPGASFAAAAPKTFELDDAVPLADDVVAVAALGVASALEGDAVAPLTCALLAPLLLLDEPRSVLRVWLMFTNCSRLLTATSWFTYSFGSAFDVGSWFFNSVTSRVRKSLDEMVAAELLELLELLVPVALLAMGFAPTPAMAWLAADGLFMIPANAAIFPPLAVAA